ncbi:MAG: triose-phosphate isomerase [Edaphobacter sp.]|uniref:triose-phosphate isomerase n=1 Tax=Edaphobacter sp. TaxID=1934404 RepID=UPI00238AABF0|nr:triose-phosphate isomerase [Edaphobacter sp.]MDE1178331.1 triose-phosphate isomerase [Edaphobacter sp.]
MRKTLVAANWKMFKTPAESTAFLTSFYPLIKSNATTEVILFPSMTSLPALVDAARGKSVEVGSQCMHWLDEGAYTGETSPTMLTAIGATHVLIGHSERRRYFNETDARVNLKLKAALAHGLTPIVCIGEHSEERERNLTANVLKLQLSVALEGIERSALGPLVIAYEPVWAIGSGHNATPAVAEDAHEIIRDHLVSEAGPEIAATTRILYGGSVKPDNIAEITRMENIDGALVGGASLDPVCFSQIIANVTPHPGV